MSTDTDTTPDAPAAQETDQTHETVTVDVDRPAEPTKVDELPEWAQKEIRKARKEAGDSRSARSAAEQQRQEMIDNLAKTLGLKPDDTPADPAALQSEIAKREDAITALQAATAERDVELAAWRSAAKQGVNASTLLDSRSFMSAVAKLDPADDGFTAAVDAAIKQAADANPSLLYPVADSASAAGIGTRGGGDDATVTPGVGRLARGYSSK